MEHSAAPDGAASSAGGSEGARETLELSPASHTQRSAPVIVSAGDIACGWHDAASRECRHEATADLIGRIHPDAVLTLGDHQYESGQLWKFRQFYGPTWGRFYDITYPSPGNHEYYRPNARGYFAYFGRPEYYSFNLGRWHIISLNSEIPAWEGSEQNDWLEEDLEGTRSRCVLAYWHRARWSSGASHGNDPAMENVWEDLYEYRADVVLSSHEHNYERFGGLAPDGSPDPRRGVRQFVVGTGGRSLYGFGGRLPGSRFRSSSHFGVLKMVLARGSFRWSFVTVGGRVLDSGRHSCR